MKKYFITGLVILLPLALTIAILIFVVNFFTAPFINVVSPYIRGIVQSEQAIRTISQIIILLGIFFAMTLIGMFARWFFIQSLINFGDRILHKIPIVNKVYKTTQEIIKTLFSSDKNSFRQVVMARFPHADAYVLGLISRESPKACQIDPNDEMLSVLIPTTPNPTTGFLIMYKRSELQFLDMRVEDAIKYIVSCGVITPEHPETK